MASARSRLSLQMRLAQNQLREYYSKISSNNTNPIAQITNIITGWDSDKSKNHILRVPIQKILNSLGVDAIDLASTMEKDGVGKYVVGQLVYGNLDMQNSKDFINAIKRKKAVGDAASKLDNLRGQDYVLSALDKKSRGQALNKQQKAVLVKEGMINISAETAAKYKDYIQGRVPSFCIKVDSF